MNVRGVALLMLLVFFMPCCHPSGKPLSAGENPDTTAVLKDSLAYFYGISTGNKIGRGYNFSGDGKNYYSDSLSQVFTLDTALKGNLSLTPDFKDAAKTHQAYLNKKRFSKSIYGMPISWDKCAKVIKQLSGKNNWSLDSLSAHFNFYKLQGEDARGNVQYTSYFIPIIDVRRKKDRKYKYPLYKQPSSFRKGVYERRDIDGKGVLSNKGLELAYTANPLDNHSMQVQGSGMVRYEDGHIELLSYGGNNGFPYSSIGRVLVDCGAIDKKDISMQEIQCFFEENPGQLDSILWLNKSYTFFKSGNKNPIGAAGIVLTEFLSVAVDPEIIPLGSVLLGYLPILDSANNLIGHQYKLLLAQDVGGAIKGAGHIDVFAGVGPDAKDYAGGMHHYGRLWLILPKN